MKTHRPARVGELIRREVSDMLLREQLRSLRGSSMVSVTDVEVTGDLRQAKIFVSIFGTPESQATAMSGLEEATSFVRQEIGRRIRLRYTPEISFVQDRSLERGAMINELINSVRPTEIAKAIPEEEEEE
ncbi:MAG: 30S ribosome-binding factor RbfA [Anaerolineae bacterium]|nr:30S ribosome-binding factor RbfA [Gloeobacterales cyanobacterium ES-bin-313]